MECIKIIDKENKLVSNIYYNNEKNSISGITYTIKNTYPTKIDYLKKIFNELKLNDDCILISEDNGIKVYQNKKNNLKHFVKDNKEDIDLFIKYNAKDATMYEVNNNKRNDKKTLMIEYLNCILVGSLIGLTVVLASDVYDMHKENTYVEEEEDTSSKHTNNVSELTVDNIIEKVKKTELMNSDLISEENKENLFNEKFLNTIVPYLQEDTLASLTVSLTMNDLKVEVKDLEEGTAGTYAVASNGLHHLISIDNESVDSKEVLSHEFIHAFQRVGGLSYLEESSCELLNIEFYNSDTNAYQDERENLKLLIDIVGSDMLLEYNFTYSDNLLNTLKGNLVKEDYDALYNILDNKKHTSEDHREVREILLKFAKNYLQEEDYEEFINNQNINSEYEKMYFNTDEVIKESISR